MSSVAITISGVLYDKYARTARPVVLQGEASLTDLGVGGGPIIPPDHPPGIWGPGDPRPQPPIPIYPGGTPNPPGIWGGGNVPMPTPPIHLGPGGEIGGPPVIGGGPIIPPAPIDPPNPPDMVKPPPPEGGWAWSPEWGWGYYPGPIDPGPKKVVAKAKL